MEVLSWLIFSPYCEFWIFGAICQPTGGSQPSYPTFFDLLLIGKWFKPGFEEKNSFVLLIIILQILLP